MSPPSARTSSGLSPSATMASASPPNTRREFVAFSSVSIQAMNIQEPALAWPFVNASSIGIRGESGSNPNPDEDPPSALPSPSEDPAPEPPRILIVEDNSADVFL